MPRQTTTQSNKEAIIEIKGELKLLHQKIDIMKDNHLSHMAQDIDRLTKFVWVVGGTVFAQMCYLIVRSIM
tara:strand:+ start:223 stop:435 length:213 start_codon:yes stop_codon:yes gene_type:complete